MTRSFLIIDNRFGPKFSMITATWSCIGPCADVCDSVEALLARAVELDAKNSFPPGGSLRKKHRLEVHGYMISFEITGEKAQTESQAELMLLAIERAKTDIIPTSEGFPLRRPCGCK